MVRASHSAEKQPLHAPCYQTTSITTHVNVLMCLNGGEVVKQAVFQRKPEYTPECSKGNELRREGHKK